ncbi:MAG TPA: histidine kinase [Micropruina sp.]|nr:histidine kinase [Micropruina sp.]
MEAGALIVAAAVTIVVTAALALRAGARLPQSPWAEIALASLFAVLLTQQAMVGAGGGPTVWHAAVSMVAWLAFLAVFPTGRPEPWPVALLLAGAGVPILGQLVWVGLAATASVAFIVAFAVGAGAQVWRYRRRSSVAERQATKWLLLGLIPALGVFLGLGLLSLLPVPGAGLLAHPWYAAAATVAMWAVPVAATVGLIVGERGPVDPLVVAVVAGTGTMLGVAAAYFAGLSRGWTPGWATVAACLAVVPLLVGLRWVGERLAYARGPRGPLSRLSERLAAAATPDEIAAAVAATLQSALGSPSSAVVVDATTAAVAGGGGARTHQHVVVFQGEQVATLEVAPRAGETQVSARDRRTIDTVARLAAPALFGARSALRAAEAAERLTRTREEERARLHADLHDDLGPTLAALGFLASAASTALDSSAATARELLARLETKAQATAGRVRELAYDLRPPELDRLGLVALIKERVEVKDGPLRVVVGADLDGAALDVDLQLAVLRIVQEGVANVRRHARANRCHVTLRDEGADLVITVADDGIGPPAVLTAGIGLTSVEQRAKEFGGTTEFGPGAVGSRLRVTLTKDPPR